MNIREILQLAPVIPVLTVDDAQLAAPLARALYVGGLTVMEITLRTPAALPAIQAMRRAVPAAIIGAGTLNTAADFARAEAAGAQFAVSPGLTPALAAAAAGVKTPLLPGVLTPTEILAALGAGYDALKFFPAGQGGGVAMLQALAGPFPGVVFCPTGGISRATAPEFLQLRNVACVGGSWVAPAALLEKRDWAGIEALARDAASLARPR